MKLLRLGGAGRIARETVWQLAAGDTFSGIMVADLSPTAVFARLRPLGLVVHHDITELPGWPPARTPTSPRCDPPATSRTGTA